MAESDARREARPLRVAGHPLYTMLLPIPIVCFIGVLLADLAYLNSPEMMWINFASWLLLAGLIHGAIAGLVLVIEMIRAGSDRPGALILHFLLAAAAWVTEVFNSLVHTRDGWTAVAGTGLTLSIVAVILSLLAGWFWQSASHVRWGDGA